MFYATIVARISTAGQAMVGPFLSCLTKLSAIHVWHVFFLIHRQNWNLIVVVERVQRNCQIQRFPTTKESGSKNFAADFILNLLPRTFVVYETDLLPCVRTQSNVLHLLCENETAIFCPLFYLFQVFILVV